MPFIQIKSLPYEKPFNVGQVIAEIGQDFALVNEIPLNHVHTTWEFFQPEHYAKGDCVPAFQPEEPHSVIVDLLTPDFNNEQTVERMLTSLASSICQRAAVPEHKIFINHRQAHSGMVFDDGKVVRW